MQYSSNPADRICLAIDVSSLEKAKRLLSSLVDAGLKRGKWGYELIYASDGGPAAIARTASWFGMLGTSILDTKLDDTPSSVAGALRGIRGNGFSFTTGHLGAAKPGIGEMASAQSTGLTAIGVSVLTSLDENDLCKVGYGKDPNISDIVRQRIMLGIELGLTHFVCSPLELFAFREEGIFEDVHFLVPGVRPAGAPARGQKRVATPREVLDAGAWMAVIGSPIHSPEEGTPADALRRIFYEVA